MIMLISERFVMSDRLLVDTNILIYAVDEDSKYHEQSLYLLQNSEYNNYGL